MAHGSSNPTQNLTQVLNTAIDVNAGNASAGTQRVVIATNQAAIPASQSGTWNIGTVTTITTANLAADDVHDGVAGTTGVMLVGFASATAPTAVAAGDAARLWVTTSGALNIADGGGSITVDGTISVNALPAGTNNIGDVDVLSVIPGVAATNLGKATNAAAGATDTGVAILGVREDALVTLPSADGDYTRLKLNSLGRVWVSAAIDTALPAGANVIGAVTQSGTWTVRSSELLGTATAIAALNGTVAHALTGNVGAAVTVTAIATPVGFVITPQVSYDGGTNWVTSTFYNPITELAEATIVNASLAVGLVRIILAADGATNVRVIATGWTSGSATFRISSSNSQGVVNLRSTAIHDSTSGVSMQLVGGFASTTAPTAVAAGDAARIWTTLNGAVNIADGGGAITVDGTVSVNALPAGTNNIGDVDVLSVIPGVAATNLGKATNAAAGATDTGVAILGVREDALVTLPSADGDYTRLKLNSLGRVWVSAAIDTALPAGANVIGAVTQSGTWNVGTVTTITTANLAADDVHDGVAGTTGVMLAGFASAVTPTAVSADGDAARIWVNRSGAQITDGYSKLGTATALAALNASAVFALGGSKSSGITITAISAPSGMVLTPQISFDGGTNYIATTFDNPTTGDKTATMTNAELVAGAMRTVMLAGGATHVRIVATAWTSGSATVLLSGSEARDTSEFFAASNNTANRPPATAQVGGWDGSNLRALSVTAAGAVNVGTVTTVTGVTTVSTVTSVTTVATLTNQAQMGGQAINMGTGVRAAGTQRVTIATDDVVQTAALPQATAALAPTNATTTAYAASLIVKATAGTLYNITGYNSRTSGQFIQLYNSATLPANGVAPVVVFFVGASSNFSFNLGVYGRHFTTGIVIGNSTTGPTKTIGAADCWFDAQFK